MSTTIVNILASLVVFIILAFISLLITLFSFVVKGFFYKKLVIYDQQIIMRHQTIMITLIAVSFVNAYFGQFSFLLTWGLYIASSIIVKLANIGIEKEYKSM